MQKATNRWGGKQDFGDGSCQKVAMDGWTVNEARWIFPTSICGKDGKMMKVVN